MICCALMIDANCIFILVHSISNGFISLMLSMISSVSSGKYFANNPCVRALLFFLGAPPLEPWNLQTLNPGVAQFLQRSPVLLLVAVHLFLFGFLANYTSTTSPVHGVEL